MLIWKQELSDFILYAIVAVYRYLEKQNYVSLHSENNPLGPPFLRGNLKKHY